MSSWCSSNPPTPSDRDWSTLSTKHQDTNSNVVYAIQCQERCNKLYIREAKQPIHKRMAQHRCATSSGQNSAVQLHLKESWHSFENSQVCVQEREDRWFERGVREAIHVKLKNTSLNRGGGLRHFLSPTYNAVLHSLGQNSKHSHCLIRPDESPTDKGKQSHQKLDQWPTQCLRPLWGKVHSNQRRGR